MKVTITEIVSSSMRSPSALSTRVVSAVLLFSSPPVTVHAYVRAVVEAAAHKSPEHDDESALGPRGQPLR